MALESGIPIPVAQHNSHDDSFPRFDNHNIEDDKEIEDEPSPICSQVPINVTIDQLVPPIAAEGATGPDIAGIAGSHHNADAATSNYSVTIPTPGVVLDTDDPEPYQMEATDMATDDPLGLVLFHPCTQNEPIQCPSIVPRPQCLTKRLAMYVSPFKGDPQRAKVPMSKALAVRKKFHPRLKCLSDVFICYGLKEFNGEEIFESFIDDEWLSTKFMSYFVACLSHDESIHMAEGAGYMVFLSPEIGQEYVNIEEDEDFSQWDSPPALAILQRDIMHVDPTKVKLFFLPVMEGDHYSVYCINFIHDRIDVLDYSPEDHTIYHNVLGDRIIRRLNLLFRLATDYRVKQFTRFKRPIIDVCMHSHKNDCGFFTIKSMELWNGESFHVPILTANGRLYRSELLFYGLYHPLNTIKKLLAGLEPYRPRL
ncbi:uncharacterized protein LOC120690347 isoform X3 [Panicum virgatum]|nr:uncharacterized protein LOC120690347 isoform X3 [Panicum virgatum]XP_039828911.1 uncharacterized protein LOC120690347 isoform X3 [Panicum virgatum]